MRIPNFLEHRPGRARPGAAPRVSAILFALAASMLAHVVMAQPFPSRPVRLVVPFPPGGSAEAQARVLAQKLQEIWEQPVVIESKPGAGTTLGAGFVAKAPPDGYTLMMAYMLSHASAVHLYRNLPFDAVGGFAPVSLVVTQPLVIAVHAASPLRTLDDLVQAARAKPGGLTYASSGTGAAPHLATELFRAQAAIDLVHVPFKGSSPALVALLGNQVDFGMQDAAVLTAVQAGKLRALAVTTAGRWSRLPEVPTIAERGFTGYEVTSSGMVLAPAGTPREIVAAVHTAVARAIAAPDVRERYAAMGYDSVSSTPEALAAMMATEVDKYGKIIRALGLRAE